MFPEISLHILDIAQNSIRAAADRICLRVEAVRNVLTVTVEDNGCGMSKALVTAVTDPFTTTRRNRRVGLGIPFCRLACELTGGNFSIESFPGVGTTVRMTFFTDHIDCMPLGDLPGTLWTLIVLNPRCDFLYVRSANGKTETLDTGLWRESLSPVPLSDPTVDSALRQELLRMERAVS